MKYFKIFLQYFYRPLVVINKFITICHWIVVLSFKYYYEHDSNCNESSLNTIMHFETSFLLCYLKKQENTSESGHCFMPYQSQHTPCSCV